MNSQNVTCIICPRGCEICVQYENDEIYSVENNGCARGEVYARSEILSPARILTTTMRAACDRKVLIPVRSEQPIPKNLMMQCIKEIKGKTVELPVHMHQRLIENVAGTGIAIVATVEAEK